MTSTDLQKRFEADVKSKTQDLLKDKVKFSQKLQEKDKKVVEEMWKTLTEREVVLIPDVSNKYWTKCEEFIKKQTDSKLGFISKSIYYDPSSIIPDKQNKPVQKALHCLVSLEEWIEKNLTDILMDISSSPSTPNNLKVKTPVKKELGKTEERKFFNSLFRNVFRRDK